MVIGTDVGGIAEINAGPFFWAMALIFGYSLSHCCTKASSRSSARCNGFWQVMPKSRVETPHGIGAQLYAKLVLDEFGHHLAGPQCNSNFSCNGFFWVTML